MDSKKDRAELLQKLMEKVTKDPNSSCWLWGGARDQHGYGSVSHKRKKLYAHRAMFTCFTGKVIPPGMCVMHSCDAGHLGCVNPKHLSLGTIADNNRDARNKGRSVQPVIVGEAHAQSKLSNAQRKEIRELWENRRNVVPAVTLQGLADKFQVCERTIRRVVKTTLSPPPCADDAQCVSK